MIETLTAACTNPWPRAVVDVALCAMVAVGLWAVNR